MDLEPARRSGEPWALYMGRRRRIKAYLKRQTRGRVFHTSCTANRIGNQVIKTPVDGTHVLANKDRRSKLQKKADRKRRAKLLKSATEL